MRNKGGNLLLGVDIGTSSVKGVLINNEGAILADASVEHDINIIKSGWVEQDPEECYWNDFKEIVKILLKKASISSKNIVGIGVSGLTPDVVPIDKKGNVVRPAIIYMDRRAIRECAELKKKIGIDTIVDRTANTADPYFAGYKLGWYLKNEPSNYNKTWKVLNADKYVIFKLTGKAAIDESTAMLYAPYYDPRKNTWSQEISSLMGGGIEKLPTIYESHEVVGEISRQASEETELAVGTPLVASGPDAVVSAFSAGMVNNGESCFMYGTTGCWFTITDKLIYDKRLFSTKHVVPGKYIIAGGMITTGALVRWFRDNFGYFEVNKAEQLNINPYQILDQEAEKVNPGSDGLIVLPYFMGERTPIWDVNAKGLIFGLSLSHTRAHIFRALLESAGYGLRQHFEIAKSIDIHVNEMLAVNGGARSRLWRQIISDITNVSQYYVSPALGAPFGDAFLAGIGTGLFKNFDVIKKYVRIKEKTMPNPKNYNLYSKFYEIYLKLYPKTKTDSRKLNKLAI